MDEPITFEASFPAIQSAILVGDDGMRIVLHIPESELPNAVALIALRAKRLTVTVQAHDEDGDHSRTPRRRAAKQRK